MSLWKDTHRLGKRALSLPFCYAGVADHFWYSRLLGLLASVTGGS